MREVSIFILGLVLGQISLLGLMIILSANKLDEKREEIAIREARARAVRDILEKRAREQCIDEKR